MGFRDLFGRHDSAADESTISVSDSLGLLAAGGVIVDVRTLSEYQRGHIPGAKLVAVTDLHPSAMEAIWGNDPLAMLDPDTAAKALIVVSSTPAHAAAVTHLLRDQQLNAYSLDGGLVGWVRDGQVLIPGPPR
ncbi:rhodanese-like domain-containing protein [Brooklawnia sp.]|uniref:rhodanese-like domain-containing protein n=1 Tax=Brooklawnia sp. TaxID=2699740 RepID=UPI00311F26E0